VDVRTIDGMHMYLILNELTNNNYITAHVAHLSGAC